MPLFWVDLEMTGLDEQKDVILEVAVVITDLDFKPLEQYHKVVFQPQSALDRMDEWCTKTHAASGLTAQIPNGTALDKIEKDLLALLDRHYKKEDRVVLVGNSVGNDKRFIDKYMPVFASRLHYRILDISSFKEIFREKYGIKFEKSNKHRAVDDIFESIKELSHYLSFVQVPGAPGK